MMLKRIVCSTSKRFLSSTGSLRYASELPDYNTSVETAAHKLQRPTEEKLRKQAEEVEERRSLIPDTLLEMDKDQEFQATLDNLKKFGQAKLTKAEIKERGRALDLLGFPDFRAFCVSKLGDQKGVLHKRKLEILQVNVGLFCNQASAHCHVESSPKRTEMMSREVADRCLMLLESSEDTHTLDITGGAPELCNEFRHLAKHASEMGKTVIDRCNLTVLTEPKQEDLGEFLATHKIEIAASLPCYSRKNVNLQRGRGVFQRSIEGLKQLNELGYGRAGTGLILNLVYNPLGAFLPPDQTDLEAKYKHELMEDFGISFNSLFTITNMPIKRFSDFLLRRGELTDYMDLLVRNFNPDTMNNVMCGNLVSVNHDGRVYDCDFNQQLDIPLVGGARQVFDISHLDELTKKEVNTSNHCFGCTAGMGSS